MARNSDDLEKDDVFQAFVAAPLLQHFVFLSAEGRKNESEGNKQLIDLLRESDKIISVSYRIKNLLLSGKTNQRSCCYFAVGTTLNMDFNCQRPILKTKKTLHCKDKS